MGSHADSDSDLRRKLRGDLIATMGNLGEDETTIAKASEITRELFNETNLDPEIATAALAVYARHGGAAEYELLWKTYQAATTPLDQVRYLRAVAAVQEEDQALSTLDKMLDGRIRTQDGFWVFARLLMGRSGPATWRAARQRWDEVLEAMPGMTRPRVVEGLPALSQPEVAADVKGFFAEHPIQEAVRSLSQKLGASRHQRDPPRTGNRHCHQLLRGFLSITAK